MKRPAVKPVALFFFAHSFHFKQSFIFPDSKTKSSTNIQHHERLLVRIAI